MEATPFAPLPMIEAAVDAAHKLTNATYAAFSAIDAATYPTTDQAAYRAWHDAAQLERDLRDVLTLARIDIETGGDAPPTAHA